MEQIRRIMRPTDVPDTGLLCDLLWADPEKDAQVRRGGCDTKRWGVMGIPDLDQPLLIAFF